MTAVAVPFLNPLRCVQASSGSGPSRLILFPSLNGTRHADFWPGSDGRLQTITAPLAPIRNHVTFVRGLRMEGSYNHFAIRSMFTGAPITDYANPEPRVRSFDQIFADVIATSSPTPIRSLHLGARPAPYEGATFLGRQNIFRTAAEAVRVQANPVRAFDELFAGGGASPTLPPRPPPDSGAPFEAQALAIVQAELQDLKRLGLGPSQQRKLDVHEAALAPLVSGGEGGSSSSPPVVPANCESSALASVERLRPQLLGNDAAAYDDTHFEPIVDAHLDLIARAITCGLTRVATLQSSWADGDALVPIETGQRVPWHPTSHDASTAYALLQKWYVQKLVRLARLLDVPDPLDPAGSSTVLDNTIIVWMSECEPSHDADEISCMVVGGRCVGLRTGGQVTGASNVQLLRTLGRALSVPAGDADQFGTATISGLLV